MKQKIVHLVRSSLSPKLVRRIEELYRVGRVKLVSLRYGNPAKSLQVIAVTGTNGKTTTVNFINNMLKAAGKRTAMFSTALIEIAGDKQLNDLNATVGTTARMQQFFKAAKQAGVDYVVLEITSHALDQHKLDGVPILAAVMTNVTQDHLDYHKTMDNYAAAKAKLFAGRPQYIILNRDDEWFEYFNTFEAGTEKITYGKTEDAQAQIGDSIAQPDGSQARIHLPGDAPEDGIVLKTHLPGEFNIYNMTAAAALCRALGASDEALVQGAAQLRGVPGRFERVQEGQDYDVIVDYAHTPDALEKMLASVREITPGNVSLVFGSCGDRDKEKRPIMGAIAAKQADAIYLTDEENYTEDADTIRRMIYEGIQQAGGEQKTTEIADRREALSQAIAAARPGDTVLVTGLGHEVYRIMNGQRMPWNDADVAREIIKERMAAKQE